MPATLDYTFQFGRLPTNRPNHIARLAVCYPLIHPKKGAPVNWGKAMATILAMWRRQASILCSLGWLRVKHPVRLRNCHPSMFVLKDEPPKVYTCWLENLCPWCYARHTSRVVRRVLQNYTPGSDIFYYSHVNRIPIGMLDFDLRRELYVRAGQPRLLKPVNRFTCAGSMWTVTLSPEQHKDKLYWQLHMRMLCMAKPGRAPILIPPSWKCQIFKNSSDADFNAALARTFRYPVGLLTSPAHLVMKAMETRKGRRYNEVLGAFRAGKKKEDEPVS
jgi:hypothetical protein